MNPIAHSNVEYSWRGAFHNEELNALHAQAFGHSPVNDDWVGQVGRHSLGWVSARHGDELIGWVNVAWDGGVHAFIVDTIVDKRARHRGIGSRLVADAAEQAPPRWLRVAPRRLRRRPRPVLPPGLRLPADACRF